MKAVGIIAEYNPFHKGHLYHLEQAKARSGAEYAIAVKEAEVAGVEVLFYTCHVEPDQLEITDCLGWTQTEGNKK